MTGDDRSLNGSVGWVEGARVYRQRYGPRSRRLEQPFAWGDLSWHLNFQTLNRKLHHIQGDRSSLTELYDHKKNHGQFQELGKE